MTRDIEPLSPGRVPLRDKVIDALDSELSDSLDCTRVWSAWSVGTMSEDDFVSVGDRTPEIADTILAAILPELREIIADEVKIGDRYATADRIIARLQPAFPEVRP